MFSKPVCGWTEWTINEHHIGSVSYISDVPYEFIMTCANFLKNPIGFNLVFDGEGHDSGLSLIGDYFCSYRFEEKEPPYLSDITAVSDHLIGDDEENFVRDMLKEAIEDFERDFDLWAQWNPGMYEDENEVKMERDALLETIKIGKAALVPPHEMELGNLLFGNSRGEYPIERKAIEDIFYKYFDGKFDSYGFLEDNAYKAGETDRGGFENEVFSLNPYYWGEDEDICELPNFVYKPENIEISWYKYPMRDSYSNIELTEKKAEEIFKACVESMKHE